MQYHVFDCQYGLKNLGYGRVEFYTTVDLEGPQLIQRFVRLYNGYLGKQLDAVSVKHIEQHPINPPENFRRVGATDLIVEQDWQILFDDSYKGLDGEAWVLHNEFRNWCTCTTRGLADLSCLVHHFHVRNHSMLCDCISKRKAKAKQ